MPTNKKTNGHNTNVTSLGRSRFVTTESMHAGMIAQQRMRRGFGFAQALRYTFHSDFALISRFGNVV
ncbi:hypothetical protein CKJ82_05560 [Corynebacterium hadale]|nr:hypothetical protein CKJ82_05560 [Corynebacterium hadale]